MEAVTVRGVAVSSWSSVSFIVCFVEADWHKDGAWLVLQGLGSRLRVAFVLLKTFNQRVDPWGSGHRI